MTSFPKISLTVPAFGKHEYSVSLFSIFPEYSSENILDRIIETSKFLNLPDFIYTNANWFLYVSSKLEKNLMDEANRRKVNAIQPKMKQKVR